MSRSPGFTLAEMLIALVLIGIGAAILIPKLVGSTSLRMRETKVRETVSVIKQLLSYGQQDQTQLGVNWSTYMQTQLNNQFSTGSFTTVIANNGCAGATNAGYTNSSIILRDGTIVRILSNGTIGTAAGEIDICIDPTGDTYAASYAVTPAGTLGKASSVGYTGIIDLTAAVPRINITSAATNGLGATAGTRNTIGSLNLF